MEMTLCFIHANQPWYDDAFASARAMAEGCGHDPAAVGLIGVSLDSGTAYFQVRGLDQPPIEVRIHGHDVPQWWKDQHGYRG